MIIDNYTKTIAIEYSNFKFAVAKEYQMGGSFVVSPPLDTSKTYSEEELFDEFLKRYKNEFTG
jgi:hypothetical protein